MALLNKYDEAGIPTVSVFLSGRPLWTNPEMNASDAFVASWLPGSEAAGITDLLFQTSANYDFTGRLSFSWPKFATQVKLNKHHEGYDPLFKLGYGLSLKDNVTIDALSEDSGLKNAFDSRVLSVWADYNTLLLSKAKRMQISVLRM